MLHKFLLFVVLIATSVSLFLINRIMEKLNMMDASQNSSINISPAPSASYSANKMPTIWEALPEKSIKKVYLSYENQDFQSALNLAKILEKDGITSVYLAPNGRDLLNSSTIKNDEETLKALKTMDVFASLYSFDYSKNPVNNQEYGFAIANGVKVVVFSTIPVPSTFATENIILMTPANQMTIQNEFINLINLDTKKNIDSLPSL